MILFLGVKGVRVVKDVRVIYFNFLYLLKSHTKTFFIKRTYNGNDFNYFNSSNYFNSRLESTRLLSFFAALKELLLNS